MTTTTEEDWRDRAACLGMAAERASYDLFFEPEYHNEAKKVCARCPVKGDCLRYALSNPWSSGEGVLGGMTPSERNRAYRRWLHFTRQRERTDEAWAQWQREDAG